MSELVWAEQMNPDLEFLSLFHVRSFGRNSHFHSERTRDTHVQVVLSLVLSDLLQDGQILLLDAVVLGLLPIRRLFFHLIVVQIFDVLKGLGRFSAFIATKNINGSARSHSFPKGGKLPLPSPPPPLLQMSPPLFHAAHTHTHTHAHIKDNISMHRLTFLKRKHNGTGTNGHLPSCPVPRVLQATAGPASPHLDVGEGYRAGTGHK